MATLKAAGIWGMLLFGVLFLACVLGYGFVILWDFSPMIPIAIVGISTLYFAANGD